MEPILTTLGTPRKRRLQGGKCADPAWRKARAAKAGRLTADRMRLRGEARAERFATKGAAYTAGYRAGYQRSAAWWREKYQRLYAWALATRVRPLAPIPVDDARRRG